ncbi:MAG: ParB N-terminal domain-containing protein [Alphaproteobacteria bacterium]
MMKDRTFPIADIYVPLKLRAGFDAAKAERIAESMLEVGQLSPVLVRADGDRFVLIEGLHRLEACKSLGETHIVGLLIRARQH